MKCLLDFFIQIITNNNELKHPLFIGLTSFLLYKMSIKLFLIQIGTYDDETGKASFSTKYILSNVTSGCMANECDVCSYPEDQNKFSTWGIAFLVIVPLLLIVIAILMACVIREYLRKQKEKNALGGRAHYSYFLQVHNLL